MSDKAVMGVYILAATFCIALGLGYGLGAWAGWTFVGVMLTLVVVANYQMEKKKVADE